MVKEGGRETKTEKGNRQEDRWRNERDRKTEKGDRQERERYGDRHEDREKEDRLREIWRQASRQRERKAESIREENIQRGVYKKKSYEETESQTSILPKMNPLIVLRLGDVSHSPPPVVK